MLSRIGPVPDEGRETEPKDEGARRHRVLETSMNSSSSDKPPSSSSSNTIDVRGMGVSDDEIPEDIGEVAEAALRYMKRSTYEISLLFCRDQEMQELNRRHRKQDRPTDVLSFSQTEESEDGGGEDASSLEMPAFPGEHQHLGDIVISIDTVRRNAEQWEVAYPQELRRVVVHGVLHLLGMDHTSNEPDQEMLQLQERILEAISEESTL